ncbi:MAG: hypothetical protein QOD84_1800 [Acidobacteriaceae bacterium]|jgi:hypothetical protein
MFYKTMQSPSGILTADEDFERSYSRISVVLPLRITYWDDENKPLADTACTYDISLRGACITGMRSNQKTGEIIAIERGRSKAFCRVVWVGKKNTPREGQVGIECVEADRLLWENELRDLQAIYDAVRVEAKNGFTTDVDDRNRRRTPRIQIEGEAELWNSQRPVIEATGKIRDLSETGCLINPSRKLDAGSQVKLLLRVANRELVFKGQVRHASNDKGLGVQFNEVRKGDRKVLQYLLRKLAEEQLENVFELELQRSR